MRKETRTMQIVLTLALLAACGRTPPPPGAGQLSAIDAIGSGAAQGFARADRPRSFEFPRDHGPHPEFAIEWWYYTGNLAAADGRRFGFQLTFFRSGLAANAPARDSAWAASSVYMAHFALTDVAGQQFHAFERFSRGAAGLAGAQAAPYRVWVEDWSAEGIGASGLPMRLRAGQGDVAIDLALDGGKPVALQGEQGLSAKGDEPGNASYYYSLTRMPTRGSLRVGAEQYAVEGLSWMDHEFATGALERNTVGWDWLALQLSDGRDLMYAQLRGSAARNRSASLLVDAEGAARTLAPGALQLEVTTYWDSPRTQARYPAGWRLRVPEEGIDLTITPLLADQELPLAIIYWEGAVRITGSARGQPVQGYGYVELTGYTPAR